MSTLKNYSVPNGKYHRQTKNKNKTIYVTVNELIRLHFIYAYVCIYLHILIYMNKSMNFKGNGRNNGRVWKMEREGQKDN